MGNPESAGCEMRHPRRIRSVLLACTVIAVLPALVGCGDDQYKAPVKRDLLADAGPSYTPPARPAVPIPAVPGGDLRTDLGIASERYTAYSNRDLVDKADIFWKLYWMTRELEQGHSPRNLYSEFDTLNRRVGKLHSDKNVAAIVEILKEVRTGLDARDIAARLSARGIRVESLPWTGGGYAMEQELRRPKLSAVPGSKPPSATTADVRIAAGWATKHHSAPRQVEQEAFSRAADLTEQLGDALDDERRQVGEHPIGRDKVAPDAGLANPYDSMFPSRPVR